MEFQTGVGCLRLMRERAGGGADGEYLFRRGGKYMCLCANPGSEHFGGGRVRSSQFPGGVTPQGREAPPHESKVCPPIPFSCLLELRRGAPAGRELGGPRQRAGRQVEMRKEGKNSGEPWEIQWGPWGETGRARRTAMRRGDLWKGEGAG